MKRAREEDELAEKLEQVQSLIDSLKKKKNSPVEELKPQAQKDDAETQKSIISCLAGVIDSTPMEISYLPSQVTIYSLTLKYPNSLTDKNRADIMSIPNIVEGAVEPCAAGVAKLTLAYCTNANIALAMHSEKIGEKNKVVKVTEDKNLDAKIMKEVESFIPFSSKDKPVTVEYPCTNDVVQVITGVKVEEKVKFSQLDNIGHRRIIGDLEIGPAKDTGELMLTIKYTKNLKNV